MAWPGRRPVKEGDSDQQPHQGDGREPDGGQMFSSDIAQAVSRQDRCFPCKAGERGRRVLGRELDQFSDPRAVVARDESGPRY